MPQVLFYSAIEKFHLDTNEILSSKIINKVSPIVFRNVAFILNDLIYRKNRINYEVDYILDRILF